MKIRCVVFVLAIGQLALVSLGDQELTPQQATEQAKIFFREKKYDLAFKMASRGDMNDPANLSIRGSMYYTGRGVDRKNTKLGAELWERASGWGIPRRRAISSFTSTSRRKGIKRPKSF